MISQLKKLGLYYRTLRYLRFRQVFFQLFYRVKKTLAGRPSINLTNVPDVNPLTLQPSIASAPSFTNNSFTFLNKTKYFDEKIDWNFKGYGKLWTYNLNYFDFLTQANINLQQANELLQGYCDSISALRDGLEPYPISLRGINWIKFFAQHKVSNPLFNKVLYSHYKILSRNLEFHLLGNHLLENGFSLLFAACYFDDAVFYKKAERILRQELKEQILEDGGHFELSPMYHQILLFRLLDCINVLKNNPKKNSTLFPFLSETAAKMLGWLQAVTFNNGDIPLVNDSANGIAPTSHAIFNYADRLGIKSVNTKLSTSGYRARKIENLELFVDVGNIGPDYIPGHAHSDTLNFILYYKYTPFIVEAGTSTYETSARRLMERSTKSHNTVVVNEREQSEIWGSFRVARRAKVIEVMEHNSSITASHNGYKTMGIIHKRRWDYNAREVCVMDELLGNKNITSYAYLHFHPDQQPTLSDNTLLAGPMKISFENCQSLEFENYDYALGFNQHQVAKSLKISFKGKLKTTISFETS